MARKEFVRHNEAFSCLRCGKENSPAQESERNHCTDCLYSCHVDDQTPGDRRSQCNGLMEPVKLDYRSSKGYMILHRCLKCRKEIWNRVASDDSLLTHMERGTFLAA